MTVANASIEARVSYQLFQSSSMGWSLSRARPALRKFQNSIVSKRRASAVKNAMLHFVARVLIARQHDLCGTGVEAVTGGMRALRKRNGVTKYLSNGATNPIHARYYYGGNICLKCALEHTRRQRPRPLQPARRGRLVLDRPSKRTTPPSGE